MYVYVQELALRHHHGFHHETAIGKTLFFIFCGASILCLIKVMRMSPEDRKKDNPMAVAVMAGLLLLYAASVIIDAILQ
ncbi:hypothetical protein [uncultured Ruminococcus sp.]|uniref:hypothetical protein n=1 Tax=uncultured Ruminococcus sp. TaxID=165186 RepID=UPI002617BB4E|nr:hypothetical protein [uncultured Ruminococcus sp.]